MARIAAYRVGLIGLVVLELVARTAAARTSERSWVLEKGQGFTTLKKQPSVADSQRQTAIGLDRLQHV